ncbi:MAG: tRNA (guanosine(46)-N7)-methyltransferase TrmB [Gammaproteobacteria bacterium]|nr:tRNA (guanosine(46)-N7)-methyltransferase TrmB [Gammaproteobacteria bacterium]
MAPTEKARLSRVRSYAIRGRITSAQKEALYRHWHDFGIDYSPELLILDRVFGRAAPRILEVGSGMGDCTAALADRYRENDYLAVEVHRPGVGSLLRHAVSLGLSNVRIISHDVMDVLRDQLPERSLDEVYIFFPDPWPKKRHHKRRLVNVRFLDLLVPRMKDNARLFLATDLADLAGDMLRVCDAHAGLVNLAGKGNFAPRPAWRPATKFERRGKRGNQPAWELCFARAGSMSG